MVLLKKKNKEKWKLRNMNPKVESAPKDVKNWSEDKMKSDQEKYILCLCAQP
jgi:hypothetical protein